MTNDEIITLLRGIPTSVEAELRKDAEFRERMWLAGWTQRIAEQMWKAIEPTIKKP